MPPWTPPSFAFFSASTNPSPDQITHGLLRGVRLGHVPGVYTSWKEAKPHAVGILSNYKRFKTRKKAEEYVAQVTTLSRPLLPSPNVVLYTDGTAFFSLTLNPNSRVGSVCSPLGHL